MKKVFLAAFLLFFFLTSKVFADSSYVLPYPSFMPGNKFYRLQEIKDTLLQYWYFGDFGQFTYNLKQADKYLVEAKTLFEYKQYLLAYTALQKSNKHFIKAPYYLEEAKKNHKNISENYKLLQEASRKHLEILNKLKKELPVNVTWSPEKATATELNLNNLINKAIKIRLAI